jgi:nickel-dependent lactate racemase
MTATLRYGSDSTLRFETASGTRFTECGGTAAPLANLAAAVETALTHPLDFPSLAQAILPGDQLVVCVDELVPQPKAIIEAVLALLVEWGIELANVTVLIPPTAAGEFPHPAPQEGPTIVIHDPAKREQLAYLAATPAGEPLYLNRVLCDADVVLPIASVRMQARGVKCHASDGLYPVFADAKTQQSAHAPRPSRRRNGRHEAVALQRPDVSWLLGVQCMLQVLPGPGDSVLAVLAGEPSAVRRESRRLCEEAWTFSIPNPASLVVAAIEGDASQQTWEQFGRALAAATEAVAEEGAIAICCDLDREPGPALAALAESEDHEAALKQIRRRNLPDAQVAARLQRASRRATVYLLSQLADDLVENLGMAPIASAAEVQRLASHHESCLLLSNAQHAVATPQES